MIIRDTIVGISGMRGIFMEENCMYKAAKVRDCRCCMCPQLDSGSIVCPAGPGKHSETVCDFVVSWVDKRGWKYRVMSGISSERYKGRYQDNKHTLGDQFNVQADGYI